jgi:hypothetical protein
MEHEEQADQPDQRADRMQRESEEVGDHIDDTRRDWEAKERDPTVPGAQPDAADEEEPVPGVQTDEETVAEEGGP